MKHQTIQSTSKIYDDAAFGIFEDGYVTVKREDSKNQKEFSHQLYYRIYNSHEKGNQPPLVVLHGGP